MGFVQPSRGRVSIGGRVVAQAGGVQLPPEKRAVGYVAQEGALYPHLTVRENVGFGLPRRERRAGARIGELLALVGLDDSYAPRSPHELSGGEQRRVALARALAPRPPLVLLDEPFSGLDAALRTETREALVHALSAAGTTALLVTHDQAEALSCGREVGVLRSGSLAQIGPPEAIYRTPADADVAQFVGEAVLLPGHAHAGVVTCALGELTLVEAELTGPVQAMVRPEQIELTAPAGSRTGAVGARATVIGATYYGSYSLVRLAVEGIDRPVSARCTGHSAPAPGAVMELAVGGDVVAYPAPERAPREDRVSVSVGVAQ
jgi:iron(III) transport system ATP-binding protein